MSTGTMSAPRPLRQASATAKEAARPRPMPAYLADPTYPEATETARVQADGRLRWNRCAIPLAEIFAGQVLGLDRREGDTWAVSFGPVELGTIDASGRLRPRR